MFYIDNIKYSNMSTNQGVRSSNLFGRTIKTKGATRAQLLVDTANIEALGYYQHLHWESTQLQARRMFL